MKEQNPERRRYIRVGASILASYIVLDIHKKRKKLAAKDISGCGIRSFIKERLKPGTLLEVTLKLLKENKKIILKARVVWLNPSPAGKKYSYEAGLEFINIDFAQRTRLSNYLQYLDREELLKDFFNSLESS